jgi:hypothetical protein
MTRAFGEKSAKRVGVIASIFFHRLSFVTKNEYRLGQLKEEGIRIGKLRGF